MTPLTRSWLLRLAVLFHLTILLAGQPRGMNKCEITCNKMTRPIPVKLLLRYEGNPESCGKPAIILVTKKHRLFCANPEEKWVQEAMEHLDRQAAALTENGGTFEKLMGTGGPTATPAKWETYKYAVSESKAAGESSGPELTPPSQEAQNALGTSPELPTRVAISSGTKSPSTSKAEDEGPPPGPEGTELFNVAAVSTTTSTMITWQSSAAYQPGSGLWVEGTASEAPSTEAPSTEAHSTQDPSTEAPTISHPAPEDSVGAEGQLVWVQEQSPMPENSPGSEEMGPIAAHTDAFLDWGPSSMAHTSVVPVSFVGTPSRERGAKGSCAPKAEETIHTAMDPQRLGALITPIPDPQAATRRQAVGLLAFLGLLFSLGVAMFAYQSLQGCSHRMAGEMVEGLRYGPLICGSNSYVLVPV
ncbi:fractalkine isoform X1 [Elephas maximus indicus]|uniref:fractalkine isoform X1 n=1 Tax=Elephas maximus indicus TaxID=99487 RepID=UPI002116D6AF|nr:fractalkine isoform X1 [Elephas maximus indicus]